MNYVKEFIVSFLPIQKQTDEYNCDSLAIAFAVEILDGKSPMEARFLCGKNARALEQLFGKQSSHIIPESLIPFKCKRSSY